METCASQAASAYLFNQPAHDAVVFTNDQTASWDDAVRQAWTTLKTRTLVWSKKNGTDDMTLAAIICNSQIAVSHALDVYTNATSHALQNKSRGPLGGGFLGFCQIRATGDLDAVKAYLQEELGKAVYGIADVGLFLSTVHVCNEKIAGAIDHPDVKALRGLVRDQGLRIHMAAVRASNGRVMGRIGGADPVIFESEYAAGWALCNNPNAFGHANTLSKIEWTALGRNEEVDGAYEFWFPDEFDFHDLPSQVKALQGTIAQEYLPHDSDDLTLEQFNIYNPEYEDWMHARDLLCGDNTWRRAYAQLRQSFSSAAHSENGPRITLPLDDIGTGENLLMSTITHNFTHHVRAEQWDEAFLLLARHFPATMALADQNKRISQLLSRTTPSSATFTSDRRLFDAETQELVAFPSHEEFLREFEDGQAQYDACLEYIKDGTYLVIGATLVEKAVLLGDLSLDAICFLLLLGAVFNVHEWVKLDTRIDPMVEELFTLRKSMLSAAKRRETFLSGRLGGEDLHGLSFGNMLLQTAFSPGSDPSAALRKALSRTTQGLPTSLSFVPPSTGWPLRRRKSS